MTGYTKLFQDIVTSTIWGEDDKTRLVWITMLALKDRKHFVSASVPGLARQANVSLADCEKAIRKLEGPDPHSRSKEYGGRRIKAVEGGWMILNGEKYRNRMNEDERREYNRQKQAEYRARNKKPLAGETRYEKAHGDGDQEACDRIAAEGL
jgi:polygalacturonase